MEDAGNARRYEMARIRPVVAAVLAGGNGLEMTGARLKVTTARVGAGAVQRGASTAPEASEYWYCCRRWRAVSRWAAAEVPATYGPVLPGTKAGDSAGIRLAERLMGFIQYYEL